MTSPAAFYILTVLAVCGFAGGIAGYNQGWAYAEKDLGDIKKFGPAVNIQLGLGWLKSTSYVKSGWAPAYLEIEGQTARILGIITVSFICLAVTCCLYHLTVSGLDTFGVHAPRSVRLPYTHGSQATQLVGWFTLVLTLVFYIVLVFKVHNKVKEDFGDNASVWPRPDWAFASSLLGSICLLGAAQHITPAGYEVAGYEPLGGPV